MTFNVNNYTIQLKCKIDLEKYNKQSYTLPPIELGICKQWRFETINDNESLFWAIWDRRQINRNINMDNICEKISDFVIQD